jgi:hypothetical protein
LNVGRLEHPSPSDVHHRAELAAVSSGFVDQLLNFADRRGINRPDGLAAGGTFNGSLETHGFVADDQLATAHRAFGLSPDIVEFMRHLNQAYTMQARR